jgi:hypothetical protein
MGQWILELMDYRITGFWISIGKDTKISFANLLICAFANFLYLCRLIKNTTQ